MMTLPPPVAVWSTPANVGARYGIVGPLGVMVACVLIFPLLENSLLFAFRVSRLLLLFKGVCHSNYLPVSLSPCVYGAQTWRAVWHGFVKRVKFARKQMKHHPTPSVQQRA